MQVNNDVENENLEQETDSAGSESQNDLMTESSSVIACHKDKIIHCLTIIGQIEGHTILPRDTKTTKYEHIIPLLVSVEEEPRVDGLLILLNTVGGDVLYRKKRVNDGAPCQNNGAYARGPADL